MTKKKTGLRTREEIDSLLLTLPKNHPVYKLGFVVGVKRMKRSSQNTPTSSSQQEPQKPKT